MIYTITLGFSKWQILWQSLEQYYQTTKVRDDFKHVILDQHYPIDKELNHEMLRMVSNGFDLLYLDAGKNLGLHDGFNYVLKHLEIKPEDKVIAYDPDSYPTDSGWDLALLEVLDEKDIGWATLMNPRCKEELRVKGCDILRQNNRTLYFPREPMVNATCAWRGDFLIASGGLHENSNYYGHLEAPMWLKLKEQGLKWAFIDGYGESDHLRWEHDRDYIVYKWCHAHLNSWDGDFESWIEAGKPNPEEAPNQLP